MKSKLSTVMPENFPFFEMFQVPGIVCTTSMPAISITVGENTGKEERKYGFDMLTSHSGRLFRFMPASFAERGPQGGRAPSSQTHAGRRLPQGVISTDFPLRAPRGEALTSRPPHAVAPSDSLLGKADKNKEISQPGRCLNKSAGVSWPLQWKSASVGSWWGH